MSTSFQVGTEAALNAAIDAANAASAGTTETIQLTGNITLATALDAVALANGVTLVIEGSGGTLSGGGTQQGLVLDAGTVAVQDLTIANTVAKGGTGEDGSGGGAGLGGGLFVGSQAVVSLANVAFRADAADGGAGGTAGTGTPDGRDGAAGSSGSLLGYGVLSVGATGGTGGTGGISPAAMAANGTAGSAGGSGGVAAAGLLSTGLLAAGGGGGGGGGGVGQAGGGGGSGGSDLLSANINLLGSPSVAGGTGGTGGTGSLGGGGGAGGDGGLGLDVLSGQVLATSGTGGSGGAGGFGGGGGGGGAGGGAAGAGGFGAGSGSAAHLGDLGSSNLVTTAVNLIGTLTSVAPVSTAGGAGGGGLGAGGDVFVQQGGSLTLDSGSLSGGSVAGGAGGSGGTSAAGAGSALGSGIFVQGSNTLTLAPAMGQTLTVADAIADQSGSGGTGSQAGTAAVVLAGPGTVTLGAADTYTGGTTLRAGTLSLANPAGAGTGSITFAPGAAGSATLAASNGATIANALLLMGGTDVVAAPTGGTVTLSGPTSGTGTLATAGGTVKLAGSGMISSASIGAGSTLELANTSPVWGGVIGFAGPGGTLRVDAGTTLADPISGLASGDTIDLAGLAPTVGMTASVRNGTLSVSNAGGTVVSTLVVALPNGTPIGVTGDGHGGTALALANPPVVGGTAGGQTASDAQTVQPFAAVTVTDPNGALASVATITLLDASGQPAAADGTLGGGAVSLGGGTYTVTAANAGALQAALRAVTFVPTNHQVAVGSSVATTLRLAVSDATGASSAPDSSTMVTVTAASTPPVITTTATPNPTTGHVSVSTTDTMTVAPLSGTTVSDADHNASESATLTLTDASGMASDANGVLSGAGVTKTGTGTYLVSGSPANVTTVLDAATFTPTPHEAAPGTSVTTTVTLAVTSDGSAPVTSTTVLSVLQSETPPTLTDPGAHAIVSTGGTVSPFGLVSVTDPDYGATEQARIVVTGGGTLSGAGLSGGTNGTYTASGSPAAVTATLRGLSFTPPAAPGSATLSLSVADAYGGTASDTPITVTSSNSAPVITDPSAGGTYLVSTTDEASVQPLTGVSITDPAGLPDSVTITLVGAAGTATDANGALSSAMPGLVHASPGVYALTGTAAQVTAALHALVFTPTAHQTTPGSAVLTTLGLSVSNATNASTPTTDDATQVSAVAVNDPPVISPLPAVQGTDTAPVAPFATAHVSDPDAGASEAVTVVLTGANGAPTDANGTLAGTGLTRTGVGTYALSGSPATVSSELQGLAFTPTPGQVAPGQSVVTTLTVSDSNNGGAPVTGSTTMTVTAQNTAPVITYPQPPAANGTHPVATTDEATAMPFAGVSVTDPAGGASDTLTVSLLGANGTPTDADGTLSGGGFVETAAGSGVYTLSAAASSVSADLQALVFTPTAHQVAPGSSVATTLALAVGNTHGQTTTDATTVVTATAVNDAPTITGTAPIAATDTGANRPFAGITITDPDAGASEAVTLTLLNALGQATDANGTLSGTGITHTGTGTYVLAGTPTDPADVTAELRGVAFTPTRGQVPAGLSTVTTLAVAVSNNGGAPVTDTNTTEIVTAAPGPIITGTTAVVTQDAVAAAPYAQVVLGDNTGATSEMATVVFNSALGSLTGLGAGALSSDGNTYTVSGTTASVQAALRTLSFHPVPNEAQPGSPVQAGFTLSVTDGTYTAQDSGASIEVVRPAGETFTWASPVSGSIGQSGAWLQAGQQLGTVPNATDYAVFNTGSATPYTVTGNGAVGEVEVLGDAVTLTGTVAVTGETDATYGANTAIAMSGGGSLTIAAGASVSTTGTVQVDPSSLTVNGSLSDAGLVVSPGSTLTMTGAGSSITTTGTLLLEGTMISTANTTNNYGTLLVEGGENDLSPSATGIGTVELVNGFEYAIPDPGSPGGTVTLANSLIVPDGTTNVVGSRDGATLELSGAVVGSGTTVIRGGTVILDGVPGGTNALQVQGATVDLANVNQQNVGAIVTLAGTTNTLVLGNNANDVTSNGTDAIQLGSGNLTVHVRGAANIIGGSGNDDIDAAGSTPVSVTGGTGHITITGQGNAIVNGANDGSVTYTGTGSVSFVGTAAGSETVTSGAGGSITTGSGSNQVNLAGGGNQVVNSAGNDTINTGAGNDTVNASGASAMVTQTSGTLQFTGGSGSYTVMGGAGSVTVQGGGGGGKYVGGTAGNNLLVAAAGNTTLIGGGGGDQLFGSATGANQLLGGNGAATIVGGGGLSLLASGSGSSLIYSGTGSDEIFGGTNGHDTIVAGAGQDFVISQGNEVIYGGKVQSVVYGAQSGGDTISGGTAGNVIVSGAGAEIMYAGTGNDTIYGGQSTSAMFTSNVGQTLIVGGSAPLNVVAGAGQSILYGSTGNDTVYAGSGSVLMVEGGGQDQVVFGSGNASVFAGTGTDLFTVAQGKAGGTDTIVDFKVGTDTVLLSGYGNAGVAQTQATSGSTVVSLTDGTQLVFSGVKSLAANSIIG